MTPGISGHAREEAVAVVASKLDVRAMTRGAVTITAEDGRELLNIGYDGTVTGDVEDANEAGRRFVESVRKGWAASLTPEPSDAEVLAAARAFYKAQVGFDLVDTSINRDSWLRIARRALTAARTAREATGCSEPS